MSRRDGKPEVLGINRRNLDLVFADYRPGKFRVLDDKLAAKALLQERGIATPRTLGVIHGQDELAGLPDLLAGLPEFVIKPARGWGGRGILVLGPAAGVGPGWVKPSGDPVCTADIAAHVSDILSGIFSLDEEQDEALIEERIHAHPFFAGIYDRGLADLRVVLDRGCPIQAMCRLPADASDGKANLHAGGVGLGIDIETGITTGAICKDKYITHHPDTGAELIGRQLPDWELCLDLSRRAAATVDLEYLGVDIVIDRDVGPLVLELNARPGLAIQLANKQGQGIAPRPGPSRFDRGTFAVAWALLLLMAILPLGFEFWQLRTREPVWVEADPGAAAVDPDQPAELLPSDLLVTDDEELSLSGTNETFARALAATAGGDTATARALYRSALADTALAPFALNNLALMDRSAGNDSLAIARLREAIERFPAYGRGYYNLGLLLLDADRTAEAIAAFGQALQIQPSHAGSWANLGQARFEQKDYAGAEAALQQAIRFQPDARNARLRLGLTYRLLDDLPRAERRLGELLALNPGSEAAAYWWARTVMEQKRAGVPVPVSRDSLLTMLAPHLDGSGTSPRCASLAACVRWENGERAQALALFQELIAQGYQRHGSRRSAAAVAVDLGEWKLAQDLLAEEADQDHPVTARLLELSAFGAGLDELDRADTGADLEADLHALTFEATDLEILRLTLLGEAAAAKRLLTIWSREAEPPPWFAWAVNEPDAVSPAPVPELAAAQLASLDCDPRYFGQRVQSLDGIPPLLAHWVLLRLARERGDDRSVTALQESMRRIAGPEGEVFRPLLVRRMNRARDAGDWPAVADLAQRLLAIHRGDLESRLALAAAEMARGNTRAARTNLNRLPRTVRRASEARLLKARIHLAEGDPEHGLRELDRILEQDPDHLEARYLRGVALFGKGKQGQAENELEAVLNRAPGRADIRRTLADQLMDRKRYGDAVKQWRRIERLGAATTSDRFRLALSLQRDDRYEECLAAYDEVLRERPDHRAARFNRSLALEKLGRNEEAQAGFRQVLALDPQHEASRRKLGLPPPDTKETTR